jgi:hypothetical protein
VRESTFWGIKKMQRMVDAITWLGAKYRGMEQFNGDEKQAIKYADDVVMRSQASGLFGHRTAIERGTIGPSRRQNELVRAFTLFYSYFARKLNITIESTKRTNFRSPHQVLGWANDMALLFVWEALLAGLIRNDWPDEDDEEGFIGYAAGEVAMTVAGIVPVLREVAGSVRGFPSGGSIGRAASDLGDAISQFGDFEVDEAFIKDMVTMIGLAFKAPSGQVNKFIGTAFKKGRGEEVEMMEWLMGPQFED